MIHRVLVALLFVMMLTPALTIAQEKVDTLRVRKVGNRFQLVEDTMEVYHLGAVIVGNRPDRIQPTNTYQRISLASIDMLDASNLSKLGPVIPAAHVQTNSRGEALLYLRNTGERQTALFFDGALLNIPWDNRIDLDMVPASAVGGVTVSKGAASAAYGANVMGGAVNIVSRSLGSSGNFTEVDLQGGTAGLVDLTALHLGKTASTEYIAAVGYFSRDGIPVSAEADLPFSQSDEDVRTNTDLRRFNGFARGSYTTDDDITFALTGSFIEAEKGTAPESHKDPEVESVRYWRYPDWRNVLVIGSVVREPEGRHASGFRGAIWMNKFSQTVESYESDVYENVQATQEDDDATFGGRFVVSHRMMSSELRLSVNGTYSDHRQVEEEAGEVLEQEYKQLLGSTGIEADIRPGGRLRFEAGLTLDVQSIPDAYVFESPDTELEPGGMVGAVIQAGPNWMIRGSVGRKSRFPTMRERFDGALGRFVVNPDLTSEKAILSELGVRFGKRATSYEVVAFANFLTGTIDQDVVAVGGENKRIRVNLGGSRSYGIEARATARPVTELALEGNAMLNYQRALDEETGDYDRRITERPSSLFMASGTYNHRRGFLAGLSIVYTGQAYSLDDSGEFVELDPSTSVNLRGGYRVQLGAPTLATVELFGRVDNAFDVVIENQLGLPGPGRSVLAGAKIGL